MVKAEPGGVAVSVDFSPIERVFVAEQVAKRLLELVRTGNLRPGDQLPPEHDLAAMLGVSRPSVREALRGLQIFGVVKSQRGGGLFVTSLDAAELLGPLQFLISLNDQNLDYLYQARVLVDGGIGRMAATRISDAAIRRLQDMVEIQAKLVRDPVGFRVSDLEFHRVIIEACENPFLDRIASSLYILGMEYRRIASETPSVLEQSVRDHRAIVAGLAARDPEATGVAMEEHMRNVDRSTRKAMKKARNGGSATKTGL